MLDFIDIKTIIYALEKELSKSYGEYGPFEAKNAEENLKKFRLVMNLVMEQPYKIKEDK